MDSIKTYTLQNVEVQENGIVRNEKGRLIARLVGDVEFEGEHIAGVQKMGTTHPPQEQWENVNTPDTEKCKHNVVGKYCFRCKRPELACGCDCLNFYKIECDCPCHSQVEIEQNQETGEVLTANGVSLTPDTEWEKSIQILDVKLEGLFNDAVRQCLRFVRKEQTEEEMKSELKSLNSEGLEHIRRALSSHTTYWKERVENEQRKYNELLLAVGNKYEGETRHQTALRYIQNAETSNDSVAKLSNNEEETI